MRAVVVSEFGEAEVLEVKEVPIPKRGSRQLLIRIQAASVNPLDVVLRRGIAMGAYTPKLPYVPGFGFGGVVEESVSSSRFKNGDRVWGTKLSAGSYAEFGIYEEENICLLPAFMTYSQGAIIDTPFRTSYWSLFDLGEAQKGDIVIVAGASGSVGSACLQVARSHGLKTIALCSKSDLDKNKKLADAAFDYRDPDLLGSLLTYLGPSRAKVFVDVAASQNVELALEVLGNDGRHIVVGPGKTPPIALDPFRLIAKGISVSGVALYNSSPKRHAEISEAISRGFETKAYSIEAPTDLPLDNVQEAHKLLESGSNENKLVLMP